MNIETRNKREKRPEDQGDIQSRIQSPVKNYGGPSNITFLLSLNSTFLTSTFKHFIVHRFTFKFILFNQKLEEERET